MVGELLILYLKVYLTSFDLWPTYVTFDPRISSTNQVWLQTGLDGWKVINPNSLAGKLSHLT